MNASAPREAAARDTPRIVVINPNSTVAVTRGIDEAIAPLRFADGPRIDCVTLTDGPPGIETQQHADAVVDPCQAGVARALAAVRLHETT